ANLTALYSGPRGCARTRDVLLSDAVHLCSAVPAQSTVRRDGDGVWWWWILGGDPARCSESDGRMICGVNEAITGMMLRLLEKIKGRFWFGVGPFERGLEFSIYRRSPGGPIEAEKIYLMA
ncbi:unnamed protein product, partial [Prunus brigantina]